MPRRANPYDFGDEAERTNAAFDAELAKYTALSADEIRKLVPTRADKEKLEKLIAIVNGASSRNTKAASLRRNIGELGEITVKLLEKVIRR